MTTTDEQKAENDTGEQSRRPVPFGWLLVAAALISAPLSPITWYAGIPVSGVVLAAGVFLQWRGFRAVPLLVAGGIGLLVASALTYGWEAYVATEHTVSGEKKVQQQRAEAAFDEAFENADTIPSGTKDGGTTPAESR